MKKNIFINLLLIFNIQIFIAQSFKTYNGAYEATEVVGTASYQYIENNELERIYQGSFKFKGTDNHEVLNLLLTKGLKTNYEFSGNFKDNKKDGLWNYLTSSPSGKVKVLWYDQICNGYTNKISGNYFQGKKIGKWDYSKTDTKTLVKYETSSVNFKDNVLNGNFIYNSNSIKATGSFNEGYMEGDWKITYKNYSSIEIEDNRKYMHGVLYWRLQRNSSTGQILNKFDSTNFVSNIFKNYNPETKISIIDGVPYYLSPKMLSQNNENEEVSNIVNFWANAIKDKISHGSYEVGVVFIKEIKIDIFKKEKDENYKKYISNADLAYKNKNLTDAVREYQNALSLEKEQYPKDMLQNIFNIYILKADSFFREKKYDFALNEYRNSLKINDNEQSIINKINQIYEIHVSNGNNYFKEKQFEIAIEEFNSALKIKENEQSIKNKIKDSKSELFKIQTQYEMFISKADDALKKDEYDLSITEYENALKIKKDNYPVLQIEKVRKRKELEKRKLESFLAERVKTNYELQSVKPEELSSISNKVQELSFNFLKEFMFETIEAEGKLPFVIDTNGVITFDFSQIKCENKKYISFIKNNVKSINSSSLYMNGYKVNCKGIVDITSKSYIGKINIEYRSGTNPVSYPDKEPSIEVKNAILKKIKSSQIYSNGYKLKYEYISVGSLLFENVEILKSLR